MKYYTALEKRLESEPQQQAKLRNIKDTAICEIQSNALLRELAEISGATEVNQHTAEEKMSEEIFRAKSAGQSYMTVILPSKTLTKKAVIEDLESKSAANMTKISVKPEKTLNPENLTIQIRYDSDFVHCIILCLQGILESMDEAKAYEKSKGQILDCDLMIEKPEGVNMKGLEDALLLLRSCYPKFNIKITQTQDKVDEEKRKKVLEELVVGMEKYQKIARISLIVAAAACIVTWLLPTTILRLLVLCVIALPAIILFFTCMKKYSGFKKKCTELANRYPM